MVPEEFGTVAHFCEGIRIAIGEFAALRTKEALLDTNRFSEVISKWELEIILAGVLEAYPEIEMYIVGYFGAGEPGLEMPPDFKLPRVDASKKTTPVGPGHVSFVTSTSSNSENITLNYTMNPAMEIYSSGTSTWISKDVAKWKI